VGTEEKASIDAAPVSNGSDSGEHIPSSAFAPPSWAKDMGRWGWIIIAVAIVLVILFAVLAATKLLVVAALFAVLLGGTFLPVVDWLEGHHFRRPLGALIVVALTILLAILIGLVIVHGLVDQVPTIQENVDAAVTSIQKSLSSTSTPSQDDMDQIKSGVQSAMKNLSAGAVGAIGTFIGNVGSLLFGIFISINIGVWVLIRGREIGAWASKHMPPVPQPTAYRIIADGARFFRGYLWGSTIVGLFNAAVLGVGALIIGVPLAGTIAIVAWLLNYIPYFGAIISGAFTVLIAYGAGGASMAIPMLILVIIANGFLQTLISQFALGSALNLHPLVVLFATTAGGILFGAVGGVFAAPFVKIALDAYEQCKAIGLFAPVATTPLENRDATSSDGSPPEADEIGVPSQT
jgi:predicted PurR-regulated permease PerM